MGEESGSRPSCADVGTEVSRVAYSLLRFGSDGGLVGSLAQHSKITSLSPARKSDRLYSQLVLESQIMSNEESQVLVRVTHLFFGLVERQACIALIESEAGNGAVSGLATTHEEGFVTMERPDARFEGGNFCVEILNLRLVPLVSQIDATE